jgi:hypothetical protein
LFPENELLLDELLAKRMPSVDPLVGGVSDIDTFPDVCIVWVLTRVTPVPLSETFPLRLIGPLI